MTVILITANMNVEHVFIVTDIVDEDSEDNQLSVVEPTKVKGELILAKALVKMNNNRRSFWEFKTYPATQKLSIKIQKFRVYENVHSGRNKQNT